jgi:hypothetical protein
VFGYFENNGYKLARVPFAEWRDALVEGVRQEKNSTHALYPLIPLFTETYSESRLTVVEMYEQGRRPEFSNVNTMRGLQGSNIQFPKLDGQLFQRYIHYFIKSGFLPDPGS